MERQQLRAIQQPLKERYGEEPSAAHITRTRRTCRRHQPLWAVQLARHAPQGPVVRKRRQDIPLPPPAGASRGTQRRSRACGWQGIRSRRFMPVQTPGQRSAPGNHALRMAGRDAEAGDGVRRHP